MYTEKAGKVAAPPRHRGHGYMRAARAGMRATGFEALAHADKKLRRFPWRDI